MNSIKSRIHYLFYTHSYGCVRFYANDGQCYIQCNPHGVVSPRPQTTDNSIQRPIINNLQRIVQEKNAHSHLRECNLQFYKGENHNIHESTDIYCSIAQPTYIWKKILWSSLTSTNLSSFIRMRLVELTEARWHDFLLQELQHLLHWGPVVWICIRASCRYFDEYFYRLYFCVGAPFIYYVVQSILPQTGVHLNIGVST